MEKSSLYVQHQKAPKLLSVEPVRLLSVYPVVYKQNLPDPLDPQFLKEL